MRLVPLALLVLLSISLPAQKQVLMEKFTNVYCGNCPNAALLIQEIQEVYENTIWISHYKDVAFEDNKMENPESAQLWSDMGVFGNPLGTVDRTVLDNSLIYTTGYWAGMVAQQSEKQPYVNITFSDLSYDLNTRELEFSVETIFNAIPNNVEKYRLNTFMVEDGIWWKQSNYYNDVPDHPLEGQGDIIWAYHHRNVVRAVLDNAWGSDDVIPDNPEIGVPYKKWYSYLIPETDHADEMEIVVSVSSFDDSSLNNRQVLNSKQVNLTDFDLVLSNTSELSIEENIYPNPTTGFLYIKSKESADRIIVSSLDGTILKEYTSPKLDMEIDLSLLSSGTYFITVMKKDKTITRKVVKQ